MKCPMPPRATIGRVISCLAASLWAVATASCVTAATHEAVVRELHRTTSELAEVRAELVRVADERTDERTRSQRCEMLLASADDDNAELRARVESLTSETRRLMGEKGEMTTERQELGMELEELRRMRQNLYPDYGTGGEGF